MIGSNEGQQDLGGGNRIRWSSVVLAALLTTVLVNIPAGIFWLGPILLLSRRANVRSALAAIGLVWLIQGVAIVAALGEGEGAATLLDLSQLALLTVIGVVFARLLFVGRSLSTAGMSAVALSVVLVALAIVFLFSQDEGAIHSEWKGHVESTLSEVGKQLSAAGEGDPEREAQIETLLVYLGDHSVWFLYAIPGVTGLFMMLSLWLGVWVTKVFSPNFGGVEPLIEWRPPDAWFWGLIGGALLTLSQVTALTAVGLNVLILGGGVYFLAGLSLSAFAVRRWGIPVWMSLIALTLLTFSGGLPYLALLGVFDFWLNFRERWRRGDKQRGS